MQSLTGKIPGSSLTAAEWNQLPQEIQNIITDLGIVLAGGDLDQLGKAMAMMIGASTFFNETGAADAYVATTIGTKQPITAYHDGMYIRFRPSNNNTGASTLNVDSVGVKDITREDGTALAAGQLITTRDAVVRYDAGADDFFLMEYAVPAQAQVVAARGYIDGLILSNNATDALNDLDISVGVCRSDNNVETIELTSPIGKQIDAAWAPGGTPGTPTGGFPTGLGTVASNTWYHVFVIKHTGTGAIGAGFDTSLTAANILADATGYANPRRIGSVLTDGSGDIIAFTQDGDEFLFDDPINDEAFTVTLSTTAANSNTLSVPPGVKVKHIGDWKIRDNGSAQLTLLQVYSPDQNDPGTVTLNNYNVSCHTANAQNDTANSRLFTRTSTSQVVRYKANVIDGNADIGCSTHGWIDARGAQ